MGFLFASLEFWVKIYFAVENVVPWWFHRSILINGKMVVAKGSDQGQESTVICYVVFLYYCCHSYSTPLVCSAVNNLPMGYPVLQQPSFPAAGQPHLDPMGCGISSCHVVNGVPAPSNFHPIRMNSGNE